MGWSDPHGVWDINRRMFPDEFAKIQAGAEAMGSRLGLWTSPSSCYPPAVDPAVGAGSRLRERRQEHAEPGRREVPEQVRLDHRGLRGTIQAGAGQTGRALSRRARLPGRAVAGRSDGRGRRRGVRPDASGKPRECGSRRPTAPMPAPGGCSTSTRSSAVSATTRRTAACRAPSIARATRPRATTSICRAPTGCRRRFPPRRSSASSIRATIRFMNDAVTTVLRGHAFISLYVNPKYMNDRR